MVSATQCPFCATPQRDTGPGLVGFAGVLLGLALAGCGDDSGEPTTSVGETSMTTTDATDTDSATSTGTGMTTAVSQSESAASDYGGPEVTSEVDTSTSVGSASSDSTGGSDSTGTDSGSSTTDTGSAESADYGGAAPRN